MATYVTNRDSGGLTDEKGHLKFLANSYTGNILDGMQVVENSPTGLSVRVSAGNIRIPYSNYAYMGWSEGYTGVSVATADPSNPRIDRVVAYVDRSMTFTDTDTNNPNALKFKAVTGTPNAVPSKPSDSAVNTSVGASNPWVEIGLVRVNAGDTTIENADITDTRTYITPVYQTDWRNAPFNVTAVTSNGGNNYDLTVDADTRSYLQAGMRLKMIKTVASQIQAARFNGTTQYANRTTGINNITFTDEYTAMGWVYLESNGGPMGVVSRRPAGVNNGFSFSFDNNNRMFIFGINGSSYRGANTIMSIPRDTWVHVAGTIKMSTGVVQLLVNGWYQYTVPNNSGTPSSLVQAGNLEVGSVSGASFFKGKMSNVALFNTVLTNAQIKQYMSRGLTGTEPNLVAGWNLDGNFNDISGNGNTLTPQASMTATDAGSPYGLSFDGSSSANFEYGIIKKVTNTTLTVQAPIGATIPTTGIQSLQYSAARYPFGFPNDPRKWQWEMWNANESTISGHTAGSWYNLGQRITAPVGKWNAGFSATIGTYRTTAGRVDTMATLNTASGTGENDLRFTVGFGNDNAIFATTPMVTENPIDIASIQDLNLCIGVPSAIGGFNTTYIFGLGTPRHTGRVYIKEPYL